MKQHDFRYSLPAGEADEALIDQELVRRGYNIRHASPAEQRQGIDRWITAPGITRPVATEYKSDRMASETGNIFIETVSVDIPLKAGWIVTSQSEYLLYFLPLEKTIYPVRFHVLRSLFQQWGMKATRKIVNNHSYATYGIIVPIAQLAEIAEGKFVLRGDGA